VLPPEPNLAPLSSSLKSNDSHLNLFDKVDSKRPLDVELGPNRWGRWSDALLLRCTAAFLFISGWIRALRRVPQIPQVTVTIQAWFNPDLESSLTIVVIGTSNSLFSGMAAGLFIE
jgi:hypothetical protein